MRIRAKEIRQVRKRLEERIKIKIKNAKAPVVAPARSRSRKSTPAS